MVFPAATLDHVVINARDDMDNAADTYRRLGFSLTERGYHSLGSMNHLAIFGTDYLELIAVPKGATTGRLELLDFPVGLNGVVFGTEDSAATHAALVAAGLPFDPPGEFTRPVRIDGQDHDARFRTVRMKSGAVLYGRLYFCHHFTRHLVWRDAWRHHPNGVVAIERAIVVAPDPAEASRFHARMFGDECVRDIDGGKALIAGNSRLDIVTESVLRQKFGDAAPDRTGRDSYMAGLTLRTLSLAKTAKALRDNGVTEFVESGRHIVVPARFAFNAMLEFSE